MIVTWINTKWSNIPEDDEESFIRFAEEVGPQALRVAYRWTRDQHVSEDLVQETLLRAWRSRKVVTKNMRAWFFKILWNVFLDYQKHVEYHHEVSLEGGISVPGMREPYVDVEDRIDIEVLLTTLPDIERYLIALRYGEDFTIRDISIITEIPVGTVKSKIHRALKQLRKSLFVKAETESAQIKNLRKWRGYNEKIHKGTV
jgi:RNA polymerase sigma-70 factor, ECF subfamily